MELGTNVSFYLIKQPFDSIELASINSFGLLEKVGIETEIKLFL